MKRFHEWPINLLTIEAGQKRRLLVKPIDITPRENIRPDNSGILRIADVSKIKQCEKLIYPEVKEAGHFHFYARDAEGSYGVYGKRENVDGYYIDIFDKLNTMHLPPIPLETVVSMELVWPGHPDCQVPTAIKNFPHKLQMKAFGVPIYKGTDLQGSKSLAYPKARSLLSSIIPPEMLVDMFMPRLLTDKYTTKIILEDLLKIARKRKIEGMILKEAGYAGWWKLKGIKEGDAFIIDFYVSDSETQYGLVTSVEIGCYATDGSIKGLGSITGFDIETKKEMTAAYNRYRDCSNENPFMHKVLRVLYQEIAGKGKLKHGFFDGWRDDKTEEECQVEQFYGDA